MEAHNVSITVTGRSFADCLSSLGASTGAPSLSLASYSDDQLLAELRQRFAKEGKVVRVAMFSAEQAELPLTTAPGTPPASPGGEKTDTAGPRPRGRPSNASKQISEEGKAIAAEKAAETKPEPKREAAPAREAPKPVAKAVADEWDEDPAGEDEAAEAPTKVTKEDVKAALNQFNAVKGMVTARQMLDRIGGSQKLMDIDPKFYSAIVVEINRELAASKAAA